MITQKSHSVGRRNTAQRHEHKLIKEGFVIMPIAEKNSETFRHFEAVYRVIRTSLEERGFSTRRADEDSSPGSITAQIVSRLASAELVVADLTDLNPNVFYELGIRHSLLRRGTILLLDLARTPRSPFDLSSYRHISWRSNGTVDEGTDFLSRELKKAIEEIDSTDIQSDNPVHDWLLHSSGRQNVPFASSSSSALENPQEIIQEALNEAEQELLPTFLINTAQEAVQHEQMKEFLECVRDFTSLRAFRPTEKDFMDMLFLSRLLEAHQVTRAILDIGLQHYPNAPRLNRSRVDSLAHSDVPAERAKAREHVAQLLRLDLKSGSLDISNVRNDYYQLSYIAQLLDTYHSDGNDVEALRIANALKKQFPHNSVVLRNYARALQKKGGAVTEEVLQEYRNAVICADVDDTSATWYSHALMEAGRTRDAIEALLLACCIDVDDANLFAAFALTIANRLCPRNLIRHSSTSALLPSMFDRGFVVQCVGFSFSCPNFGTEAKTDCVKARKLLSIEDDEVDELIASQPTTLTRGQFILPYYEQLKSNVTFGQRNEHDADDVSKDHKHA